MIEVILVVYWGKVGVGMGDLLERGIEFWGCGNVLCIDWEGGYTGMCKYLLKVFYWYV